VIGSCLASSGLGEVFGQRISADEVRAVKPSPLAYRHAAGRLARPAGRICLVACKAITSGTACGSRLLPGNDEGRAS
jgi:beta-phosphoglucomutase-like phosphatase (HAD superfamily)